ncbi:hypothetical protein PFISCL1PPCAC_12827, partial [Pristionchus fissidentatus]
MVSTLTVATSAFAAVSMFVLIFMRMQIILDSHSRFRLSCRQQPEMMWIQDAPDAIIFGEMFELGSLNIEIGWLAFSALYGSVFLPSVLIYSAFTLAREKRKLQHVRRNSAHSDNATQILLFQMFGSIFSFIAPLVMFFVVLKFGFPSKRANLNSV